MQMQKFQTHMYCQTAKMGHSALLKAIKGGGSLRTICSTSAVLVETEQRGFLSYCCGSPLGLQSSQRFPRNLQARGMALIGYGLLTVLFPVRWCFLTWISTFRKTVIWKHVLQGDLCRCSSYPAYWPVTLLLFCHMYLWIGCGQEADH